MVHPRSSSIPFSLIRRSFALAAVTFAVALPGATGAFGASLEVFVLTAGGQSSGTGCSTYGPPAPVYAFFGSAGISPPAPGLAPCGVAGEIADTVSPTGPIYDARSLSAQWNTNSFAGNCGGWTTYGRVSAAGHGSYSGSTSSSNVVGTEGMGICHDTFTITSPSVANGQTGGIVFYVTVTGGLSTTGTGTADVEIRSEVNAGATSLVLRSQVNNPTTVPFITSVGGTGLSGFTGVPGSISGSGQVKLASIPITFGTSFDFALGELAYAQPILTSNVDSDFSAVITRIDVTGPTNQPVPDAVITTGSGASYGPNGVTAVSRAPRASGELLAFPNPSATGVTFRLNGGVPSDARMEIFDAAGRRVRDALQVRGGEAAVWWDGRDDRGAPVASGPYFARLTWFGGTVTARVTLLH